MNEADDLDRFQRCLDYLGEHYDTVQIFCTVQAENGDGTISYIKGVGNLFARQGQVRAWLMQQEKGEPQIVQIMQPE